jgi:NaMN:DMB phosphoribosyltransferase
MGRTRKSVVLAVMVSLATICPTHTQPVTFVTSANAHASLVRFYSASPHFRSRHLDPNDAAEMLGDEWPEAATPKGWIIGAYVVAMELLLAGVVAAACLLVLALAGAVVKLQKRPTLHAAPITSLSHRSLVSTRQHPN